jgi:hypothetical protein
MKDGILNRIFDLGVDGLWDKCAEHQGGLSFRYAQIYLMKDNTFHFYPEKVTDPLKISSGNCKDIDALITRFKALHAAKSDDLEWAPVEKWLQTWEGLANSPLKSTDR